MTVNVSARPTTADLGRLADPGEMGWDTPWPGRERGPSPWEGERVRRLSRCQIDDRLQDLGDLYADTSRAEPWAWNQARTAFLRRLALDVRRPGFTLLIAENTHLTGCAHGFPVRGDGPWWEGFDGYLPRNLLRLAAAGRLFAVSEIVVQHRVRTQNQDRDWNLARRLQRRLLDDQGATLGVTLVNRADFKALETFRSWGWRDVAGDTYGMPLPAAPCRLLVLGC